MAENKGEFVYYVVIAFLFGYAAWDKFHIAGLIGLGAILFFWYTKREYFASIAGAWGLIYLIKLLIIDMNQYFVLGLGILTSIIFTGAMMKSMELREALKKLDLAQEVAMPIFGWVLVGIIWLVKFLINFLLGLIPVVGRYIAGWIINLLEIAIFRPIRFIANATWMIILHYLGTLQVAGAILAGGFPILIGILQSLPKSMSPAITHTGLLLAWQKISLGMVVLGVGIYARLQEGQGKDGAFGGFIKKELHRLLLKIAVVRDFEWVRNMGKGVGKLEAQAMMLEFIEDPRIKEKIRDRLARLKLALKMRKADREFIENEMKVEITTLLLQESARKKQIHGIMNAEIGAGGKDPVIEFERKILFYLKLGEWRKNREIENMKEELEQYGLPLDDKTELKIKMALKDKLDETYNNLNTTEKYAKLVERIMEEIQSEHKQQ